jgi:hypothetical protein
MSKNPLINALGASSYILLVVTLINFVSQTQKNQPDTIFAPIAFLSLLTLSAAVMSFLFFYQPLLLFIDGKKKAAVDLFLKTIAIFASFTALAWTLLISGII